MPKFKKGSPEAKAFMAKLRRMKKKSAPAKKKAAPAKKKSIGATQGNLFAKPNKPKQRGTSNLEADKKLKAKAPGKRKSSSGGTYYESRRNRSDIPGTMAGIGSIQSDLNRKLAAAKNYLAILQGKLAYTTELYKQTRGATHKAQLPTIRKKITEARRVVMQLKKVAK
jgi:hypothetical protein